MGRGNIFLVGMMGSGKTTVGTRVAEALQWPFLDSDQMIEAREGRTVREIWLADGEPAYRDLETKVLEDALALPDPGHEHFGVGQQGHRPLLDDDPLTALRRLATEREELYREVADATVETSHAPIEAVAEDVLRALAACEAP